MKPSSTQNPTQTRNEAHMATQDTADRIEALRTSLRIAADLIGPDIKTVDPEYTRAISEFGCMTSDITTEHKESFEALAIELAQTTDPDRNVDALATDLEASADLIGPDIGIASADRPDYIRALSEHACLIADISGHHAESVHAVLVGVLTND